jgi:hypothetical protein
MELFCKGPIVTCQSYDGGPSTCIDHILMNNVKKHTVIHAEVLDSHSFALSDHHPVLCTLILEFVIPTRPVKNYEQSVSMNFHIHPMLSLRIHETLFCRLVALKISTGLVITMAVINPVNTMSAHRITETCQIIIPIWFHRMNMKVH